MYLTTVDIVKILAAVLAGGLIGFEREYRDKDAGFRTLIFICVGAALFTILSVKLAGDKEPTRIAANIVSGVGFLGAGVILRNEGRVMGLTTASAIWLTAALGMGIGGGYYALASVGLASILVVLWIFPLLEHRIGNIRHDQAYTAVFNRDEERMVQFEAILSDSGLQIKNQRQLIKGNQMISSWNAAGAPQKHKKFVHRILAEVDIEEFHY
jgi:putative Mg2+ transporter-C (MgtC) family protein